MGRLYKQNSGKNPVGRPTVITPEILKRLEEVFAIGGSDEEACFYADIGKTTLYNYQQIHPEFVERKEALKQRPVLLARQTVARELSKSYGNAMDYLSRKRKDEFGNTSKVEVDARLTISSVLDEIEHGQPLIAERVENIESLPDTGQTEPTYQIQEESSTGSLQPEPPQPESDTQEPPIGVHNG